MIKHKTNYAVTLVSAALIVIVFTILMCLLLREKNNNKATESQTDENNTSYIQTDNKTDFSITYDFYYTTETLEGEKLEEMLNADPDGSCSRLSAKNSTSSSRHSSPDFVASSLC